MTVLCQLILFVTFILCVARVLGVILLLTQELGKTDVVCAMAITPHANILITHLLHSQGKIVSIKRLVLGFVLQRTADMKTLSPSSVGRFKSS